MIFLLSIFLALSGGRSDAATKGITFSETFQKVVKCGGIPLVCKVTEGSTFSATVPFQISAEELAGLDEETEFHLRLGSLQISHKLGDDPAYVPGKTSLIFLSTSTNETGGVVATQTVSLKLKGTLITAKITAKSTDLANTSWQPIVARDFSGRAAGNINDGTSATISLGNTGLGFSLLVKGKVSRKTLRAKDGNSYNLPKVSLKGTGIGSPVTIFLPVHVEEGVDAPAGGGLVDNSGGTILVASGPLAGLKVEVPAGAVVDETQFTVAHNDASMAPRSGIFPGDSVSIHTDGQTSFDEPLMITVPFDAAAGMIPVPYYVTPAGYLEPCEVVKIDHVQGTMSFQTFHASLFTWIYAYLTGDAGGHTSYRPATDGFQIVNYGSVYNPGGECFGISAFAQWFFSNKGGGLYPRYMQNIPTGGSTVKGQNIIATRAHTSVSRLWESYIPLLSGQYLLTGAERFASITNVLDNTAEPAILYLSGGPGAHAVLAYDHAGTGQLSINDPNHPGLVRTAGINAGTLTYDAWSNVRLIGNGSFRTEAFENIYLDAQSGFSGNGAAQVEVSSHTNGQSVSDRTITLSGIIESGSVLVDRLIIKLDNTKFEREVGPDGSFSIPINLVGGENLLSFQTQGHDLHNNVIDAPNTQLSPFIINCTADASVILVTLTWNTDDTDLDLYTIDPTGDFSAYYQKTTADGGELDFDDTTGFGPEHWTLSADDVVRWDEEYDVRIHYYSDHQGSSGPAVASRWNINVLLNEGTPEAESFNFSGVLAADAPSNDASTDNGPDWADVCTIVPVEPGVSGTTAARMDLSGAKPKLLISVPNSAERLRIKQSPGVR